MTKRLLILAVLATTLTPGLWASGAVDTDTAPATAPAPAAAAEGASSNPAGYDRYHWTSPAEFEADTGVAITSYGEAPALAQLVAQGELPPVVDRLPVNPMVLAGVGRNMEIGKYGGTGFGAGASFWQRSKDFQKPVTAEYGFTNHFYPQLIESYDFMDGGKTWVFYLREGLKWSDGMPYTADDMLFWHEDFFLNSDYPSVGADYITLAWRGSGIIASMDKVDDYTVRFEFHEPTESLLNSAFGSTIPVYSKHYLEQFHPNYQDADKLQGMIEAEGFATWVELLDFKLDHYSRTNPEKPRLTPWVLVQGDPNPVRIYERNPYYWAVDTQGNQLPYIDEIHEDTSLTGEVLNLAALSGDLDVVRLSMDLFPEAKQAEADGKIVAVRWPSVDLNTAVLNFNLNTQDEGLRAIFGDKRFRFAVSHAIDRELINEAVYRGMSQPWQVAPQEGSPIYHEGLANAYLEHDPDLANRLLDEIGLEQRGNDGFRLRQDGSQLAFTALVRTDAGNRTPENAEIVVDNLRAVGLDVNLRIVEPELQVARRDANDYALAILQSWGTIEGGWQNGTVAHWVPAHGAADFWAPLWTEWYFSNGAAGEQPPQIVQDALGWYQDAMNTMVFEDRAAAMKKILDAYEENLWQIGTVQHLGHMFIFSTRLRNYPAVARSWHRAGDTGNPALWWIDEK